MSLCVEMDSIYDIKRQLLDGLTGLIPGACYLALDLLLEPFTLEPSAFI